MPWPKAASFLLSVWTITVRVEPLGHPQNTPDFGWLNSRLVGNFRVQFILYIIVAYIKGITVSKSIYFTIITSPSSPRSDKSYSCFTLPQLELNFDPPLTTSPSSEI